jgi:hypothetical protein
MLFIESCKIMPNKMIRIQTNVDLDFLKNELKSAHRKSKQMNALFKLIKES